MSYYWGYGRYAQVYSWDWGVPSPGDGWITVWRSDPNAPEFMPPLIDRWHGDHTQLSVREQEAAIRHQENAELAASAARAREFRESQGLASCLHQLRTARLLPLTWGEQNAQERTLLLAAFVGQNQVPGDVLTQILALCDVNEVVEEIYEMEVCYGTQNGRQSHKIVSVEIKVHNRESWCSDLPNLS